MTSLGADEQIQQLNMFTITHCLSFGFLVYLSGHLKIPQPDNAEEDINGSKESCIGLLNNIYEDGIRWSDHCHHHYHYHYHSGGMTSPVIIPSPTCARTLTPSSSMSPPQTRELSFEQNIFYGI